MASFFCYVPDNFKLRAQAQGFRCSDGRALARLANSHWFRSGESAIRIQFMTVQTLVGPERAGRLALAFSV